MEAVARLERRAMIDPAWLALAITLTVQFGGMVWFLSRLSTTVRVHERTAERTDKTLCRVEDALADLDKRVSIIEHDRRTA